MPAEFEDPSTQIKDAQNIGRPQILRWALLTALIGAVISMLGPVLAVFGLFGPVQAFPAQGEGDGIFVLHFLSGVAPPFLFVGAGLALAATVEMRRAPEPVDSGTKIRLWLAWGLLAITFLGVFIIPGTP
jgi:hypothetical protein